MIIIKFILKIIRAVLTSLIIIALLFLLTVSWFSKKFPPDIKIVEEYARNLLNSKEHYSLLINKSEKYLNTEFGESSKMSPKLSDIEYLDKNEINIQIKQIKSQLNRIEEQNKIIIENLKK